MNSAASFPPLTPQSAVESHPLLETSKLVVMLATYNGAGWIDQVLEGYHKQRGVDFPWALVVVNNASTDATADILARYVGTLPLIVVDEPRPGKNAALNHGLELAASCTSCNYIFTDDDAVPAPDFLEQWNQVLAAHPQHALFGGTVDPCFDGIDQTILCRYAKWHPEIYAINRRPEGDIAPGDIFGPNMAVSGDIIRAGYRFNEAIGPSSSDPSYPMGSETEFCVRITRDANVTCWFAPAPSVQHIVRPNQATEAFILARAHRHGRGCATKDGPLRTGPADALKARLLIARFSIGGLLGDAEARWNAAWHGGLRAGLRDARNQLSLHNHKRG